MSEFVTTQQLSQILNISKRRIQQLVKSGIISKAGFNKFDPIDCLSRYMEYRSNINQRENSVIRDLKTTRLKIQTEIMELDLGFRTGKLIRKSDFVQAAQGAISIARSKILGLPVNLASKVIGLRSKAKIERIFQEAISGIFDELGATFSEKLKDLISENK